MIRPREFLDVLENDAPPLHLKDVGGALLLHLMVHMFFADEELDDQELAVLKKLVGGADDDLREQVTKMNALPMSYKKLAEIYPERADQLDIITLAEHGFWADNQMEASEMDVLDKLADVFGIEER